MYAINLKIDKQLSYKQIYNYMLIELETSKTYIKTNSVNSFIWFFRFFSKVFILFIKWLNSSFNFYGNYQNLNTIFI